MGDDLGPVALGTGRTATAISAGSFHTCALLDNGTVKCWGHNNMGQLGQGNTDNLGDGGSEMGDDLDAIPLGTGRTATAISAGHQHTCALLDNGTVKCWGSNLVGELGQGNTDALGDGMNEMGDDLAGIALGTGRTAKQISAGYHSSCAMLDNNTLKCWGWNGFGQLGQGNTDHLGDGGSEMGDDLDAINLGTGATILPVELVAFTALLDGAALHLAWHTASETNNAGFELQHTAPTANKTWEALAFITGRGTTTEAQAYQRTLTELTPGLHRFRLKQIDFDGTFAYSPITEVFVPLPEAFSLSAPYPNPFVDETTVRVQVGHVQEARVAVYDGLGREVAVLHAGVLAGDVVHTFRFAGAHHASGVYVVAIESEQGRAYQRVVLAK